MKKETITKINNLVQSTFDKIKDLSVDDYLILSSTMYKTLKEIEKICNTELNKD